MSVGATILEIGCGEGLMFLHHCGLGGDLPTLRCWAPTAMTISAYDPAEDIDHNINRAALRIVDVVLGGR
jgi:hypothetical protein